jgi:hypothetical protein
MLQSLESLHDVDILSLRSPLDPDSRRVLFRASDAVLANSRHEPFGLVGLETMAVGGVACTGCSGEDYAVAGRNALVLETMDPREFLGLFGELRANPKLERAIRRAGRATARQYTWCQIMQRHLLPRLRLLSRCMPLARTDHLVNAGQSFDSQNESPVPHSVSPVPPLVWQDRSGECVKTGRSVQKDRKNHSTVKKNC